jgi:two-component system response regulator YesN
MEIYFSCILADDEPTILSSLAESHIWEELGIKIIAKEGNGIAAFESIRNLKPDFALLDIRMPGMMGLEVLRKCSEIGSRTQVIIISGYDDFSYARDALKYGAKAFLLKPIDYTELSEELRVLIARINNERSSRNPTLHNSTSFFGDLIEGRIIDSSFIVKFLPSLGENLADASCYVMCIIFPTTLSDEAYQKVLPLLEKSLSTKPHKIWFKNTTMLVGIFNTNIETPFETATHILDFLLSQDYPRPTIGIGDVVPGLYQCSYSYSRALTAVAYRLYANERHIFSYLDICTTPPPKRNLFQQIDLPNLILSGDLEKIQNEIGDFLQQLLYVPMPSPNYVFSLSYAFAENISSSLRPVLPEDAIPSIYNLIPRCMSLTEIKECIFTYCKDIIRYIDKVYGLEKATFLITQRNGLFDKEDKLIRKAKIFIKENIHNKIYVSDVAHHVNFSETYFASYFKANTGQTLRDYLQQEKMEWAGKELLKKTMSVEDIAYYLGYSDYHAFTRAFKKVYGQTPSDFREKTK